MKIINLKTNLPVKFKSWLFPDQQIGFKIEDTNVYPEVRIVQRITNTNDICELFFATDALRRIGVKKIQLTLPYVPYARQDRVMTTGESLSIKVMADLINLQKYDSVTILDPHSDMTPALLDNCIVKTNYDLVKWALDVHTGKNLEKFVECDKFILVSPDVGAAKKIYDVAKSIGYNDDLIIGGKHRDVTTGQITGTYINKQVLHNEPTCFIVDDICDGGRTFIELAKVLRQAGAGEVYLIVTHGIFSAGFKELSENLDGIFVTNSFKDIEEDQRVSNNIYQLPIY